MSQSPLSPPYDVMVVDDSAAIRSLVTAAFAKLPDYRVRTAATVDEGRAQLRLRLPDILLLDCHLDGAASGVDVLAASPVASAPITIVFSASADDANTLFNRFEQVVSRLLKPFQPSELVDHVREAIHQNQEALEFVRNLPSEPEPEPVPAEPAAAAAALPPAFAVVLEEPPEHIPPPPPGGDEELDLGGGANGSPDGEGAEAFAPAPLSGRPLPPPPQLTSMMPPPVLPLESVGSDEELPHPFAAAILAHPDVIHALNRAVRALFPDSEAPLACGPSAVLHPSTLIGWARRQRQVMRLRSHCETELCDIWFAGGRVVGVATDMDGRRGQPMPAKLDLDGIQQEDAVHRVLMVPPNQYLELRAFNAPPAWTMMQSPAAIERLSRFVGS